MSDKYIIKNCPSTYQNFEDKFVCTTQIKQKEFPCYCQDCTDCLLKQIVKKCRKSLEVSYCTIEQEILELLDIEGVE